jgi:hypothetical protein
MLSIIAETKDKIIYKTNELGYILLHDDKTSTVYQTLEDLYYSYPISSDEIEEPQLKSERKLYLEEGNEILVKSVSYSKLKELLPQQVAVEYVKNEKKLILLSPKVDVSKYKSENFKFNDFIYDPNILTDKSLAASKLAILLEISEQELNFSLKSLKVVDEKLNNYFINEPLYKQLMSTLPIYLFETVKNISRENDSLNIENLKLNQITQILHREISQQYDTGHSSVEVVVVSILFSSKF